MFVQEQAGEWCKWASSLCRPARSSGRGKKGRHAGSEEAIEGTVREGRSVRSVRSLQSGRRAETGVTAGAWQRGARHNLISTQPSGPRPKPPPCACPTRLPSQGSHLPLPSFTLSYPILLDFGDALRPQRGGRRITKNYLTDFMNNAVGYPLPCSGAMPFFRGTWKSEMPLLPLCRSISLFTSPQRCSYGPRQFGFMSSAC